MAEHIKCYKCKDQLLKDHAYRLVENGMCVGLVCYECFNKAHRKHNRTFRKALREYEKSLKSKEKE